MELDGLGNLYIEFEKLKKKLAAEGLFDEKYKDIPKKSESAYGNIVEMQIVKTKVCKPDRLKGSYSLIYDSGVDALHDLIDLCMAYNIIHRAGAWFTFVDVDTGELILDENGETAKVQGEANVREYLLNHEELLTRYKKEIEIICKECT